MLPPRSKKCFGNGIGQRFTFLRQNEIAVRLPEQPQSDKLISLAAEIFQLSGGNSVARAKRKRDSLGAFHLIREILARFMRRLTGKNAINVGAIIADILPALHPNGRNRARSDSQIIFAEPVRAIMN